MPLVSASDETRLYYELEGSDSRPVLMFSNSLGTNFRMWHGQVSAFADRYRILRYGSRGHGKSDAPPGEYSIERLGEDVVNLLDALNLDRIHFCGLSKGGMGGMWLGIHASHRFKTLALIPSAYLPPTEMWNSRIVEIKRKGISSFVDGILRRWFTSDFIESGSRDLDSVRQQFLNTPVEGYTACCAAIRDMDLREQSSEISTPTLVITGREDPATPPEHGKLMANHISNADYFEVANAAHLSNIEQPGSFNAAFSDFLERNRL